MIKDSFYNWTPEQKETFEKKQIKTNEALRNYYIYTNFIENTSKAFSMKRRALMKIVENGINQGTINQQVRMMSRIKSNKSAYENKIKHKNLDDIFATTILTTTQEELEYIRTQLKINGKIQIVRMKKINKAQFVAEHFYLLIGRDVNVIECRLQTIDDFEHSYSHTLYKAIGDKKASKEEIKAIEESKQNMYNSGSAEIYSEIPLKWYAQFDEKTRKMYERQLTTNEVLKELYPFLKLREEKER
ncbi:MAG: hypothetical protein HFJ47_04380 [Clostridia bacterium]|nr:hypothetical protein [Clostridia bacterium]